MKNHKNKADKTLEVTIRFWTHGLPQGEGLTLAWDSGVAYLRANPVLGVKSPKAPTPFTSLFDLQKAVVKTLGKNVALVPGKRGG